MMNIKLLPLASRYPIRAHCRVSVRKVCDIRQNTSTRRISGKLKELSDENGVDELIAGLNNSLSRHAFNSFEQQLNDSSLPSFLRDELKTTVDSQFGVLKKTSSIECQNQCDMVVGEILPPNIWENHNIVPEVETTPQDINQNTPDKKPSCKSIVSGWSRKQCLSYIYDNIVMNCLQTNSIEEVSKKTTNWLSIMANSMAGLQVDFLQEAMNNLKTMQENINEPHKSQETLDAMSDDDRITYINLRSVKRRRFISAQSSYQANMRLFSMTCRMMTALFSLFSRPSLQNSR
jgi:hypothetical protein